MSRSKGRGVRSTSPRPAGPAATKAAATDPAAANTEVGQLHDKAQTVALTDGVEAAASVVIPATSPGHEADIHAALSKAREAERIFEAARRRFEERTASLTERDDQLRLLEARLREDEVVLAGQKADLDAQEGRLAGERSGLEQLGNDLKGKELEARAGFIALQSEERRHSLELLEAEIETGRAELAISRRRIEAERAAWLAERDMEDAELRDQQTKWRKEVRELQTLALVEREIHAEDQEMLALRAERGVATQLEVSEAKLRDLQERLDTARAERDRLYAQVREHDDAQRLIGHATPEDIRRQIDQLTRERDTLKQQLAASIGAEERSRLEDAARDLDQSEGARSALAQENADLRARLSRFAIAVTELETLRDEKAALESSRDLLHTAVQELSALVDERIRRTDGASPFQQCSAMDLDPARQDHVRLSGATIELGEFAEDLRQRIAYDSTTGKVLYYTQRDIRCLLGGMAMSRLHLLQGISGTGKTSLPLAAARAIGAGWRLVEVQAGWRDRHDLVGHFNEFERRFYETEFLQALYEAQCPAFQDRPYVIVLDEMNLSHPEQYFADLLSALELDPGLQKIDLMTAKVEPAPRLFIDGRTLRVPSNVWFVGTANHDETTMGFADKTYDRAHVMELPRHKDVFEPRELPDREPISVSLLIGAFESARRTHALEAARAYTFIVDELNDILGDRFGIGWGNRLERQMGSFVPVVVAAGGSIGEAVDHITATKLLRRIRDRHDNRIDDLDALSEVLTTAWTRLKDGSEPERSLEIIERERHRLGQDDGR